MTQQHDARPRPQYGEYAETEGGEPGTSSTLSPGGALGAAETSPADPSLPANPAPPAAGAAATHSTAPLPSSATSRLPGVPHNLGVRGGGRSTPTRTPQNGEPYRAADPTPHRNLTDAADATGHTASAHQVADQSPDQAPATPYTVGQVPPRPRSADRIATIALLALGGYFALSMALSLSQLPAEFAKVASDIGLADFTSPPQVQVIGTVGAILVLSMYALVLIFSVRRIRARKLAFWAPLAAGALAWVVFFVLFAVGLSQSAELWQSLMQLAGDPEQAQQLLDKLRTRS